jgi:hypothetical protein
MVIDCLFRLVPKIFSFLTPSRFVPASSEAPSAAPTFHEKSQKDRHQPVHSPFQAAKDPLEAKRTGSMKKLTCKLLIADS